MAISMDRFRRTKFAAVNLARSFDEMIERCSSSAYNPEKMIESPIAVYEALSRGVPLHRPFQLL